MTAAFNLSGETGTSDPAGEDMFPEPGRDLGALPVDPFGELPGAAGQPPDARNLVAARIVKLACALADALEQEAHEPRSALAPAEISSIRVDERNKTMEMRRFPGR